MQISEMQLEEWLRLPQTKLYLECIKSESEIGRESLFNGDLSGNADEVGTDYLAIINKCEALDGIIDAESLLRGHECIMEDDQ